jgi:hypothetical protein
MKRYFEYFAYGLLLVLVGCANYEPISRPVPKLSVLSHKLSDLSRKKMESYLNVKVDLKFPMNLAVAKVENPYPEYISDTSSDRKFSLELLAGSEANGWRKLSGLRGTTGKRIVSRVQLVTPSLLEGNPTLTKLRDAAAELHSSLLLIYMQADNSGSGFNANAAFYWTGVGLFFVPGDTVGFYTAYQAVLVDVRTGVIIATAEGEAKREWNVPPLSVKSTRERIITEATEGAISSLQENVTKGLIELEKPGK